MADIVGLGGFDDERPLVRWKYYESPEGQDIATKMLAINSYAMIGALFSASFDVVLYSRPWETGPLQTIGRFGYTMAPFFGCASAFTMTSSLLCRVRERDDRWNYFAGGLAAGSVFGAWRASITSGVVSGVAFGVFAVVKKMSIEEGWNIHQPARHHMLGTARSNRHDFTWLKDPPKGWTSDPSGV